MTIFNINILIIDNHLETKKDFIKILKYSNTYHDPSLDALGYQILSENYNDCSIKVNLPKCEIYTASYAMEAIEIIKGFAEHNKKFALVFIDLYLIPEMTGTNTIQNIWNIDQNIQIVVCTSLDDFVWKNILKSFEVNDNLLVLQKPFYYNNIRQLIYTLTKKWLLIQAVANPNYNLDHTRQHRNFNNVFSNDILTANEELVTDSINIPKTNKRLITHHHNNNNHLINNIEQRTKELEYKANHDSLTSLANRNLLENKLLALLNRSKHSDLMFAIFYIDLDNFKWINDNYTHAIGDQILKIMTKRILHNIRENDELFRIGGDEFVLLLSNIKNIPNINNIANHLLHIINEPIKINHLDIETKLSIGISIYPMHGMKPEELLKNSDLAMYKAKEFGGNRFEYYSKELYIATKASLDLELELEFALKNNEFFLCYLPQIELASKKLIALEALIRWNHKKLGVIPAAGFIPYAEKYGFITHINSWVLQNSILQNKIWYKKGLNIVPISANIGIQQIRQPNFAEEIFKYLKKADLNPNYFGIDITENSYVNTEEVIKILKTIKKIGIQITLDNFGSGYIPLNYLKKLQIDYLKIDKSLIEGIEQDQNNKVIIESIIDIANSLKLKVIAVGIETGKHKEFFEQRNCQYAEGYYFNKPLLPNELELLLK